MEKSGAGTAWVSCFGGAQAAAPAMRMTAVIRIVIACANLLILALLLGLGISDKDDINYRG